MNPMQQAMQQTKDQTMPGTLNRECIDYVLGFLARNNQILLVKKLHGPILNKGKWNGIGGKVEEGETFLGAMTRECREETGYEVLWRAFGTCSGEGFRIGLFVGKTFSDREAPRTNDVDEELSFVNLADILALRNIRDYAQNVQVMVMHVVNGEGQIHLNTNTTI